jgi:hypothetical protein
LLRLGCFLKAVQIIHGGFQIFMLQQFLAKTIYGFSKLIDKSSEIHPGEHENDIIDNAIQDCAYYKDSLAASVEA